jgi:Kef-type K+ transport system membrane component KefB
MNLHQIAILFFLQLLVILGTCQLIGGLARWIGQPQVVAEMIAGVILGPSVFGWLLPTHHARLFPSDSQPIFFCASQVGLSLYMFLVGLEFRLDLFRAGARSAAAVSIAGMLAPFGLGALIAAWLIRSSGYFSEKISAPEAMLYLGASMCITAFPMLARIIVERRLSGTVLGTLALAAGAMDDAAAWCLLAIVLASFEKNPVIAVGAVGGGLAYAVTMLTLGRWGLKRWIGRSSHSEAVTTRCLTGVLILVMLASWITDIIGIYAIFGAFILGVSMPRGEFADQLSRKLEPLVITLLLPLFFTYSGLNTRLDLITTASLWLTAAVVLLAACLGKGVACWAAARLTGADQPTALAVGALMNARGLMELIILNVGLQRGLITPQLFTIMVMMAILTTLLASPLFEMVYNRR